MQRKMPRIQPDDALQLLKQAGFHDATISGKVSCARRLGKVFSTRNNASAANGAFYNRTTFTNTDNDFMGKLLALPKV